MAGHCRRRIRKLIVDGSAMQAAMNAVITKKIPVGTAARLYGVNAKMLQHRLDLVKTSNTRVKVMRKLRNDNNMMQVFTPAEEKLLEEHLLKLSKMQQLTLTCIRKEAYEYALKLPHCRYPKKWDHMQLTGINWAYSYRSRHPELNMNGNSSQSKGYGSAESESVQPESDESPVAIPEVFEAKAIIVRVYHYLEKEYEYLKFFGSGACESALANVLRRTAAATGVREHTVAALLQQSTAIDPLKHANQDRHEEHSDMEMITVKPVNMEYHYETEHSEADSSRGEPLGDEPSERFEDYEEVSERTTEELAESSSDRKPHKKKNNYSPTLLNAALKAIREGATVFETSRLYGIPRATLRDKRDYKHINEKYGLLPALNYDEEKKLAEWIQCLGNAGFRVTKTHLLDTIAKYVKDLNRPNQFKNGVPGRVWFRNFIHRHPIISNYVIYKYKRYRVTDNTIRLWYTQTEQYFKQNNLVNVVKDPDRIFHCGEIGLFLNPTVKQVVVRNSDEKDLKIDDEKELLTVVVNVSASGSVAPSMILYRHDATKSNVPLVPAGWRVCNSQSRRLENDSFSEYIIECFYPWLVERQKKLPVVLFLDGCANYISPTLLAFCQERGIFLTALLPNAGQLLQPLEAAVFRPLEQAWRSVVWSFTCDDNGNLNWTDIAIQVKVCLDQCVSPRTIEAGFRSSGIYPFGYNYVNYSRTLVKNRNKTNSPFCE